MSILKENPQIELREYIYNMPELMVAADLVISRAGASSLNEIAASGHPEHHRSVAQCDGQPSGEKRTDPRTPGWCCSDPGERIQREDTL